MPNDTMFLSAQGLKFLRQEESAIDGLYDDPSDYCTFGVGHLVHPGSKWSCFLLQSASGDELFKAFVAKKWPGTSYETPYLQRSAAFHEKFNNLKTLAVENAKQRIGKQQYKKDFTKLTKQEQEKATSLAQAAVDEQARILAKTVDDVLKEDVKPFEAAVRKVKVTLNQDEFDALVSFAFNIGETGFANSDALKEINKGKYNTGDAKQRTAAIGLIAAAFARRNTSGGKVLKGLTNRRKHEADLFLKASRAALAELEKAAKLAPASSSASSASSSATAPKRP
jgi:GH24 family phage-related lysozyme (muramidase)